MALRRWINIRLKGGLSSLGRINSEFKTESKLRLIMGMVWDVQRAETIAWFIVSNTFGLCHNPKNNAFADLFKQMRWLDWCDNAEPDNQSVEKREFIIVSIVRLHWSPSYRERLSDRVKEKRRVRARETNETERYKTIRCYRWCQSIDVSLSNMKLWLLVFLYCFSNCDAAQIDFVNEKRRPQHRNADSMAIDRNVEIYYLLFFTQLLCPPLFTVAVCRAGELARRAIWATVSVDNFKCTVYNATLFQSTENEQRRYWCP